MARKKVDFEERLEALEALVEQMEEGDLTLEESLKAFEQGIKLTRECQSALTAAEQKVNMLIEEQGQLQVQPFETDEE
jgi:exodeoxyribonuclease VII small subunit